MDRSSATSDAVAGYELVAPVSGGVQVDPSVACVSAARILLISDFSEFSQAVGSVQSGYGVFDRRADAPGAVVAGDQRGAASFPAGCRYKTVPRRSSSANSC